MPGHLFVTGELLESNTALMRSPRRDFIRSPGEHYQPKQASSAQNHAIKQKITRLSVDCSHKAENGSSGDFHF